MKVKLRRKIKDLQNEIKQLKKQNERLRSNQKEKPLISNPHDQGNPWASGNWVDAY